MEVTRYSERLVPSTRFVTMNNTTPSAPLCFVSPAATLVGDVHMGAGGSVWYGAVVRGDVNSVRIGSNTSIGENCVVHVAKIQGDRATNIGDNVTIQAGAIVHAATLGSNVLVGARAQVLDGAVVEDNVVLLPGAVASPGSKLESMNVYGGVPAKQVRKLTAEEVESLIVAKANEVTAMAGIHAEECGKTAAEVAVDEEIRHDKYLRSKDHFQPVYDGSPLEDDTDVLGQGQPGRIFDNTLASPDHAMWSKEKKIKPANFWKMGDTHPGMEKKEEK
jgi:carbonic anhydrase/acetyltransferase-like protein (isoleucine patch superfamily)